MKVKDGKDDDEEDQDDYDGKWKAWRKSKENGCEMTMNDADVVSCTHTAGLC